MGGDAYWFDSCHQSEELIDACAVNETCYDGACVAEPEPTGNVIHVENPGEGNDIAPNLLDAWNAASDGDTILLPAGNFSFNGTLRLGYPEHELDGVHIKGRGDGPNGTKLYRDYVPVDNEYFISFVASSSRDWNVEVSDIRFEGPRPRMPDYSEGASTRGIEALNIYRHNIYLHDCTFRWFNANLININHKETGVRSVISDNRFVDNFYYGEGGEWHAAEVIVVSGPGGLWPDITFGSDDFVFVEDNYFEGQADGIDAAEAGRYVFRHNTVKRMVVGGGMTQMHPAQPDWVGGPDYYAVATRAAEIYNNAHYQTPHDDPLWNGRGTLLLFMMGGEAVVWGNTIHEPDMGVDVGPSAHWFDCYDDPRAPENWTIPDYPIPYQAGYMSGSTYGEAHAGTDPAAEGEGDLFVWDNRYVNATERFYEEFGRVREHDFSCQEQEGYIIEGRDYHFVKRPGYEPYEYPHPRRSS